MENKDKVIKLAKKLKALAEQGVGGEKENAIDRLGYVMQKYNISEADIMENERKSFVFDLLRKIDYSFIAQVLSSVIGSRKEYGCDIWEFRRSRKKLHVTYRIDNIEPDKFSEFIIKVEMFWKHYQKELEIFYDAFIQKNKLYCLRSDNDVPKESEPLSPEDMQRLFKTMQMMEGIEAITTQKQIE